MFIQTFNSLFEMPFLKWREEHKTDLTFNSLFEMPGVQRPVERGVAHLSILYLRCRRPAGHSMSASLRPFNSLFEMLQQ